MLCCNPVRLIQRVFGTLAVCAGVVSAQPGVARPEGKGVPMPPRDTTLPEPLGVAEFDGGMTVSGDISVALERDAVGYSMDGAACGVDEPRWANPRWVIGASSPRMIEANGAHRPYDGGFDEDGTTPVVLAFDANRQILTVHRGAGDAEAYWGGASNDTYWKRLTLSTSVPADLLLGQSNAMPGVSFVPGGGVVWNGFIAVSCAVRNLDVVDGLPVWQTRRTALVWTTTERLRTETDPWVIGGISRDSGFLPNKSLLQHWSISKFPLDDQRCVVFVADYRSPATAKNGGILDGYLVERSGESVAVTGTTLFDTTHERRHSHVGGLIVHGDGSATAFVSYGDATDANVMLARDLADLSAWGSADPDPLSGLNGVGLLRQPSAFWSQPYTAWGEDGSDATAHNQVISMAPGDSALSSILCGGDENGASILRLRHDPLTDTSTFEQAYQPQVTSNPSDGVLVFGLHALRSGGPYIAVQAGTSWASADGATTRLLWSPDGVWWGHLPSTGADEQSAAVFEGEDRVLAGSIVSGRYRAVDLGPERRLLRPLMVGGSETPNLLAAGDVILPEDKLPGTAIRRLGASDLEVMGIPHPPCHTDQLFDIDHQGATGFMGVWRLTGGTPVFNGPPASGGLLVKAWVYSLPPAAGGRTNTSRLGLTPLAYRGDGALVGRRLTDSVAFDPGRWTPITLWIDATRTDGMGFYTQSPGLHRIDLDLSVWPGSALTNPQRFLVCFERVGVGSPTVDGHGGSPGSDQSERLVVSMSKLPEWTLLVEGFVPEHAWDARTGTLSAGFRPTSTMVKLEDDSNRLNVNLNLGLSAVMLDGDASTEYQTARAVRQSVVRVALAGDGDRVWLRSEVGGLSAETATMYDTQSIERLVLGDSPLDVSKIVVYDRALPPAQLKVLLDSPPAATPPVSCPADLDSNGRLDFADLGLFLSGFGAGLPVADLNGDAAVNFLDVSVFLEAFGRGCPGAP